MSRQRPPVLNPPIRDKKVQQEVMRCIKRRGEPEHRPSQGLSSCLQNSDCSTPHFGEISYFIIEPRSNKNNAPRATITFKYDNLKEIKKKVTPIPFHAQGSCSFWKDTFSEEVPGSPNKGRKLSNCRMRLSIVGPHPLHTRVQANTYTHKYTHTHTHIKTSYVHWNKRWIGTNKNERMREVIIIDNTTLSSFSLGLTGEKNVQKLW